MNAPLFFCKSRARRRSIHPILSCKVDCWMYVCSYYFKSFSSFWGLFWRAWGAFGVLLAPRGVQGDSRPPFFSLFPTFGALGDAKGHPREPKRVQKSPKRRPKWSQSAQKATPESDILDFNSEKLLFNILIPLCSGIRGFTTSEPPRTSTLEPLGLQKAKKTASETRDQIKHKKQNHQDKGN